jgi:hypothetical protein
LFTIYSRDSIIVAIGDTLTAIFAGFVIFAILGYMSNELGVGIEDVATQGTHGSSHNILVFKH